MRLRENQSKSIMNPQPNPGPSIPAVNTFTRRSFMKTSALTVGAVALLSQGKALGDGVSGNNSSTIPQINPPYGAGVKRTNPAPATAPTSVSPTFGVLEDYEFLTTVDSPCGVSACKQYDEVEYVANVTVKICGIAAGLTVSDTRHFVAFQVTSDPATGPSIHSWEVTSHGAASIQPSKGITTTGGSILIDETTYRLSLETERTACGANTVSVRARALLKNLATNEVTALEWTAERETVWQDCESSQ